jgi:hypothetical protein
VAAGQTITAGPPTARWVNLGPPALAALDYHGARYDAGLQHYRLSTLGVVPVYSLSLGAKPNPATQLEGVDPASSGVAGLRQATYLAGCSRREGAEDQTLAAAHQIAIWHFTDDVPVTRATVPSTVIRRLAGSLISRAQFAVRHPHRQCGALNSEGFSSAAFAPMLTVIVDPSDGAYQTIEINLQTGSANQYPTSPQALEVRVDETPSYPCTGDASEIQTSRPTVAATAPSCGAGHGGPQRQYPVRRLGPSLGHGAQRLYAVAVLQLPRSRRLRQLKVLWNNSSAPGVVYIPRDGSQPVISAAVAYPDLIASASIR